MRWKVSLQILCLCFWIQNWHFPLFMRKRQTIFKFQEFYLFDIRKSLTKKNPKQNKNKHFNLKPMYILRVEKDAIIFWKKCEAQYLNHVILFWDKCIMLNVLLLSWSSVSLSMLLIPFLSICLVLRAVIHVHINVKSLLKIIFESMN